MYATKEISNAIKTADIIIFAVKPHIILPVLADILPSLQNHAVIISVAARITMTELLQATQNKYPVVRVMPNTPASIGEGTFAVCYDDPTLSDEQAKRITEIFRQIGQLIPLPELRLDAFTAIMGCGSAYIFYFMDAITEAGVHLGFTYSEATALSKRLFSSSSKLAEAQDLPPTTLREQVCSPAGVTIQAIQHLDHAATKGYIIEAILKAYSSSQND